jgi:hypothetical protein
MPALDPNSLSKQWHIALKTAKSTLKVTPQRGLRSAISPIHRRYQTNMQQLWYNRLNSRFYSDTMIASSPSLTTNKYYQIFANDFGFVKGYAFDSFFQDVGVPSWLHTDGAKERNLGRRISIREKVGGVSQTTTKPGSPWQNRAEGEIREVKKQTYGLMSRMKASKHLWDFAANYVCNICCRTARPLWKLMGQTPWEVVTGTTPDILEWIEFDWYQPVWYQDPGDFPNNDLKHAGRWLGVSHQVGQALCYWIMLLSGQPIARTTVCPWTDDDRRDPNLIQRLETFDQAVGLRVDGDNPAEAPGLLGPLNRVWDVNDDNEDDFEPMEPDAIQDEADDFTAKAYYTLISAQVLLQKGEGLV